MVLAGRKAAENTKEHPPSLKARVALLGLVRDQAAIWAIAHQLAHLTWKILHDGVHYIERREQSDPNVKRRRAQKMVQVLRRMGYRVEISSL